MKGGKRKEGQKEGRRGGEKEGREKRKKGREGGREGGRKRRKERKGLLREPARRYRQSNRIVEKAYAVFSIRCLRAEMSLRDY